MGLPQFLKVGDLVTVEISSGYSKHGKLERYREEFVVHFVPKERNDRWQLRSKDGRYFEVPNFKITELAGREAVT